MIDLRTSLTNHYPGLGPKLNKFEPALQWLHKWLHLDEINAFIAANQHLKNFNFLDAILQEFAFSYRIDSRHLKKIPAEGRVVIVANHPIGSLDGLALLRMVYDIRPDVKIIATPLLSDIEPIQDLFLPIDNISKKARHKSNIERINRSLQAEHAVIIFPAGEVSRITTKGIQDGRWKPGFIRIAERNQAPILPVLAQCRNSALFYATSMVYKPLSTLMLIHEMYKQKNNSIRFITGDLIEPSAWQNLGLGKKKLAQRFKKHLFGLKKNKPKFKTTATIAHPIQARRLHAEIKRLEPIGRTQDGMSIYLMDYQPDSLLIQEIGRLRELSFRMVQEGTGTRVDLDAYDVHYKHIVLWNDKELEIVGAYRVGFCGDIIARHGMQGMYCASLHQFGDDFTALAPHSLELGRSFVQPKYWGLRGLEYLWYGIGAVLNAHPDIKHLFGVVSIPGNYPDHVMQQMVQYHAHHFPKPENAPMIQPNQAYDVASLTSDLDQKTALKQLNKSLKAAGVKLPVLFKQYTDLCEPGGVGFVNFSVDPEFNDCVDGLIWLNLDQMKSNKKAKYLGRSLSSVQHR